MNRADCLHGPRPCLRFSCRHNLALEVTASGTIQIINGPEIDPCDATDQDLEAFVDDLLARIDRAPSCALDVVDRNPDGVTLQVVADLLGVTRERVRQIETKTMRKLAPRAVRRLGVVRFADGPTPHDEGG